MIRYLFLFLIPIVSSAFLTTKPEPANGILELQVSNVKKAQGWIWVGIYDSEENFLIKEKAIVKGIEVNATGTVEMKVDSVKFGDCAVAIFHDINGNGEMDRNWLGIPTEPYAFSRKPRSKWRLPRFQEVLFDFKQNRTKLTVELARW